MVGRRIRQIIPVAAIAALAHVAVHGERARACGWSPSFRETLLFNPDVLNGDRGMNFDPWDADYDACGSCALDAQVADWQGYLASTAVTKEEIISVLHSTLGERPKLVAKLTKKHPKAAAAFAEMTLASKIESFAYIEWESETTRGAKPPAALLLEVQKAQQANASDPFLAQRYAFLAVRVMFYQEDFKAVIDAVDKTYAAALKAPSNDMAWRAKWYLAGALRATKQGARANLELARIGGGYAPLAGGASLDFRPMEEADWKATLKLATTAHDQALVWRLVGIKHDGLGAAAQIQKVEPTSTALPLLAVRELTRAEQLTVDPYAVEGQVDADAVKAQTAALAKLEKIALAAVATPKADRPAVMELVLTHLYALRGDLPKARTHAAAATKLAPGDAQIISQANISLSLAVAKHYKISPQSEIELAGVVANITPAAWRGTMAEHLVRATLAKAYLAAGRRVEAEFLTPGEFEGPYGATDGGWYALNIANKPWDQKFVGEMLAKATNATSGWDKFLVNHSYSVGQLQRESVLRMVVDGDFTGASKAYATFKLEPRKLYADPFKAFVQECFDCDAEKYAKSKWTDKMVIDELAKLEPIAKGTGEPAAAAALKICTALYATSENGLARAFYDSSHQYSTDTHGALAWCKSAFDTTAKKEIKAQAAWLAAKAEVGASYAQVDRNDPNYDYYYTPIPKNWYPVMLTLKDTKYYKEVLKQCGWFQRWSVGK